MRFAAGVDGEVSLPVAALGRAAAHAAGGAGAREAALRIPATARVTQEHKYYSAGSKLLASGRWGKDGARSYASRHLKGLFKQERFRSKMLCFSASDARLSNRTKILGTP